MPQLSRALTVDDWWLIVRAGDGSEMCRLHPEAEDRFWADPFLLERTDSSLTILCEEFDYETDLGTVVQVKAATDGTVESVTPILGTGVHESYPFPFTHDGRQYCLPEVSETGHILLFERHDDGSWTVVDHLLPGVAGLDPTLVIDPAGLFWLFATVADAPQTLRLWWAEELHGPWTEHVVSPIQLGRGARPAGRIFRVGDTWRRPGQNSSVRYGGSIVLYSIDELSIESYREHEMGEIGPPDGFEGTHTLDGDGEVTVIDAVRRRSVTTSNTYVRWRARQTGRTMRRLVRR